MSVSTRQRALLIFFTLCLFSVGDMGHTRTTASAAVSTIENLQTRSRTTDQTAESNTLRRLWNWITHVFHRAPQNGGGPPPTVSLSSSSSSITTACAQGTMDPSCILSSSTQVWLVATAGEPDRVKLRYSWTVTGGKISGEGKEVSWDLSGVLTGTYMATVEVDDGSGHMARTSTSTTVARCPNCTKM